ncbi:MAG: YicC/YloC family endoribonuclease [Gemmobacter sp.]
MAVSGLMSMTAFASRRGTSAGASWSWDLRSVNGKGLDLRLRLPEGVDGLEAAIRAEIGRRLTRGSVSLTLRLQREGAAHAPRIDLAGLETVLRQIRVVQEAAERAGVTLAPPSAAELFAIRGVADAGSSGEDEAPDEELRSALLSDLGMLLDDFTAMRAAEGRAIGAVVLAQIDRIADAVGAARTAAAARRDRSAAWLGEMMERVLGTTEAADPARLAQELALIAIRADVTEELDRLEAHVAAARTLIAAGTPAGRKLDFLTQEFLREVNTLCSKSQATDLTAIGLELKHVIDQMREQVQNLE